MTDRKAAESRRSRRSDVSNAIAGPSRQRRASAPDEPSSSTSAPSLNDGRTAPSFSPLFAWSANADAIHTPTKTRIMSNIALQSTPISHKTSATGAHTSTAPNPEARATTLVAEMKGKFVGPMPVDEFLTEFLPCTNYTMKAITEEELGFLEAAARVGKNSKEKEPSMYDPLIMGLRGTNPELDFTNTSNYTDSNAHDRQLGSLKPDISIYHSIQRNHYFKGIDPMTHVIRANTVFSLMEMSIEVKAKDDAFNDDPKKPFECETKSGEGTRAQIIEYAVAQLASGYCTHIFSVLIVGAHARLIRWDRAGAIVTEVFSYSQSNSYLVQFFQRYRELGPDARGMDNSVDMPSEQEKVTAERILGLKDKDGLAKFAVPHGTDKTAYYVGRMPDTLRHISPTGRCTRTFIVCDLETERRVFLKDTWRIDLPDMVKEGDVYRILKDVQVQNIAPFLCDADIHGHRTCTQDFARKRWARRRQRARGLRPHQQYRVVLDVIGRGLDSFRSSRELVTAMRDALQAHKEAYKNAHILHRDISFGNILITEQGRGLLIDWDMSKSVKTDANVARQSERTGTWQFMSARLLQERDAQHTLADDLESFLHVLSWVALRFMPHKLPAPYLSDLLYEMFDKAIMDGGETVGGRAKEDCILSGRVAAKSGFKDQRIRQLIKVLTQMVAERYIAAPIQDDFDDPSTYQAELARHEEKLDKLNTSDWMLKVFDDCLANPDWPIQRPSKPNDLVSNPDRRPKRKSVTEPELRSSSYKKRRSPSTSPDRGPIIAGEGENELCM